MLLPVQSNYIKFQTVSQMSREEIDRILSQDITQIDSQLTKKIQNIEQITDQLALKSNFLVQFQLLLQQELSTPIPTNQVESAQAENQQADDHSNMTSSFIGQQHSQALVQDGLMADTIQMQRCQQCQSRRAQINLRQHSKERQMLQQLKKELEHYHYLHTELKHQYLAVKNGIQKLLQTCRTDIIETTQSLLHQLILSTQHQYQSQLQRLERENQSLKQEISLLKQQTNPLKELTFNQFPLKPFSDFTATQKFNNLADLAKQENFDSPNTLPNVLHPIYRTHRSKKSSQSIHYQPLKAQQQWYCQEKRSLFQDSVRIPLVKPLKVGVPPVKEGFGILKSGNKIIYKGMWNKGKFEGKGKLQWQNYVYEGEFKNGLFWGYGILQISDCRYIGRFEDNKAEGEGTLQLKNTRKYGFWRENELMKQY